MQSCQCMVPQSITLYSLSCKVEVVLDSWSNGEDCYINLLTLTSEDLKTLGTVSRNDFSL